MASDNVNEQRVVINFYTLLGKSFSDICGDLHTVYGDSCISKSAITKWMNHFKEGRDTTKSDGGGRVVRWYWVNFQCRGVLQFGLQ